MTFEPCTLCGSRNRNVEYELAIGTVVACPSCGLVSLVDDATGRLVSCSYDESYFHAAENDAAVGYSDYFGAEAGPRTAFARSVASGLAAAFPGARRSLDVGCAGGYLVAALAERGFDAYGVDMSRYAVTHGVAGIENRLLEGDLSALDGLEPFELITMMDVIEHLPDPVSAVRQTFSQLAAGGTLILLTPRYGGRLLAQQGAEYVHFNSDHMYYFTEQTLSAVIRAATGLTPITADVLSTLHRWNALIPPEVRQKYTEERDSIIATVSRP